MLRAHLRVVTSRARRAASCTRAMLTDELNLWCASPNDLAAQRVAAACAALLSDEEQQRWQRFRNEAGRRESLTSRALARIALAHAHPIRPEEWKFEVNPYGKPRPVPECGLRFNLSNSHELVVCLVAHGAEVGVDVEPVVRAAQMLRVAEQAFSPLEREQLAGLPSYARLDRALSLWTLKEAYIKARGMGLSLPLKSISLVFDTPAGVHLELDAAIGDDPLRWTFCWLDHAGHRIAVMAEQRPNWKLTVREVRPPLAPPVLLPAPMQGWFPLHEGKSRGRASLPGSVLRILP